MRACLLVWLIFSAVVAGGIGYAQSCYSYLFCDYPLSGCYGFFDQQCGQYGGDIVCQAQLCENYCGYCIKRRCVSYYYLCWNNDCGTWICA